MRNAYTLRESFDVLVERDAHLARRFYEILFERHPQVRGMFVGSDAESRERMFLGAVTMIVIHAHDDAWLEQKLAPLGAKHLAMGMPPSLYRWVGECFLAALVDVAGSSLALYELTAWAQAFDAVAAAMMDGAHEAPTVRASLTSPLACSVTPMDHAAE